MLVKSRIYIGMTAALLQQMRMKLQKYFIMPETIRQ